MTVIASLKDFNHPTKISIKDDQDHVPNVVVPGYFIGPALKTQAD